MEDIYNLLVSFISALQIGDENLQPLFELPHKTAEELAKAILNGKPLVVTAYFILDLPEDGIFRTTSDNSCYGLREPTSDFKQFSLKSEDIISGVSSHFQAGKPIDTLSAERVLKGIATGDYGEFPSISDKDIEEMIQNNATFEQVVISIMQAHGTKALAFWNWEDWPSVSDRESEDCDVILYYHNNGFHLALDCGFEVFGGDVLDSLCLDYIGIADSEEKIVLEHKVLEGEYSLWSNWNFFCFFPVFDFIEGGDFLNPTRCYTWTGDSGDSVSIARSNVEKYYGIYVPSSGMASSMAGELIRAVGQLQHRWDSNSDIISTPYSSSDASSSVNTAFAFIRENVPEEHYCPIQCPICKITEDDDYDGYLAYWWAEVFMLISSKPELLTTKPKDSREFLYLPVKDSVASILNSIAAGETVTAKAIEQMYGSFLKYREDHFLNSEEEKDIRLLVVDTYLRLKQYGLIPDDIAFSEDKWLVIADGIDISEDPVLQTKYEHYWTYKHYDFGTVDEGYYHMSITGNCSEYLLKIKTDLNVPFAAIEQYFCYYARYRECYKSHFRDMPYGLCTDKYVRSLVYNGGEDIFDSQEWSALPIKRKEKICRLWIEKSDQAELRMVKAFILGAMRKSPTREALIRLCEEKKK